MFIPSHVSRRLVSLVTCALTSRPFHTRLHPRPKNVVVHPALLRSRAKETGGNSFSSVRKERKESLRIHSDIARASFVFITLRIPLPKRYPPRRDVERKKGATDFFFFFFLSREKRVAVSTRWKFEVRAKNLEKLHHEGGELSRDSGRRRLERARQLTDVSRDVRRMWAERFIAP